MGYSPQAILDLVLWNIIKVQKGRTYLTNDFRSYLSENVRTFRYTYIFNDDGPAIVQTIKDMSDKRLTNQQIKNCLNIIVPLVKEQMGGKFFKKDRFAVKKA